MPPLGDGHQHGWATRSELRSAIVTWIELRVNGRGAGPLMRARRLWPM